METLIRPVFTLELNYKILQGLIIIGKYDGTHPCLTAATTAEKILIHSPHRRNVASVGRINFSETNREIATLNIGQTIAALEAGNFIPDDEKDVLIIGTATHILAYHVHDNKDIFYKECVDGVKAIKLGYVGDTSKPMLFVGGNSAVHGYNHEGAEIFWTAIGDIVSSLMLFDYNKDGLNELMVSSDDFKIRVYKKDTVITEILETEVVTSLLSLPDNRFAYSVSNGTIGVYDQEVRIWRVKSKHFAISMQYYDLLGKGSPQLVTGWSNGKIDCRSIKTGEVLFKDSMSASVAGLVEGDYRSVGKLDLICVSKEGSVRGYTTTRVLNPSENGSEQDAVRDLLAQKQSLLMELKQYESNLKYNLNSNEQLESLESQGVIPANTRLQIGISNEDSVTKNSVEIFISTNNSTIIRAVIIFAEGIFDGESYVVHPPASKLSSQLIVPLKVPKDNAVDIHIKAIIGFRNSEQYHVFEITRQLPKFSMYAQLPNVNERPPNYVEFVINERLQRICMWINQNFLLGNDVKLDGSLSLEMYFRCLRDDSVLVMIFENNGKVDFYSDDVTLASDLVQSLIAFLKLDVLESNVHFPMEEKKIASYLEKLNEIQDARLRLGADVADKLGRIRCLIVKAEDSRLNDMKEMPGYYKELNDINKELINGYNIRLSNYNEGVNAVKEINYIIQKASRMRAGEKASQVLNLCRTCIQNNNVEGLVKVIRTGEL